MNISRLSFASALFTFVAPSMACTTEQEADPVVVDTAAPITTISLENGNQVEFYEPSPGLLLVSELGNAGVSPGASSRSTPVELYRELAPGQPVPAALVAAQARAQALPPSASPKVTAESQANAAAPTAPANLV
jgi:hypothetical protein